MTAKKYDKPKKEKEPIVIIDDPEGVEAGIVGENGENLPAEVELSHEDRLSQIIAHGEATLAFFDTLLEIITKMQTRIESIDKSFKEVSQRMRTGRIRG